MVTSVKSPRFHHPAYRIQDDSAKMSRWSSWLSSPQNQAGKPASGELTRGIFMMYILRFVSKPRYLVNTHQMHGKIWNKSGWQDVPTHQQDDSDRTKPRVLQRQVVPGPVSPFPPKGGHGYRPRIFVSHASPSCRLFASNVLPYRNMISCREPSRFL